MTILYSPVEMDGGYWCEDCQTFVAEDHRHSVEPTIPAPLQQSEAERLHDEIVDATRQINEMCDRLDDLIEQHRQALGKEDAE